MFIAVFLFFQFVDTQLCIGNCDLNQPPTSWLVTSAIGITDWATAGIAPNGPNFCLQGDKTTETVKVAYHINLPTTARNEKLETRMKLDDNPNNLCINKDPRIQYCFALCGSDFEEKAIRAALSSGTTWIVADILEEEVKDPNWAITVLAVDYNNPQTHLNISSFLDPDVWCSVYVGIKPKIGFPYLFEIQLGNVISEGSSVSPNL